MLSIAMFNLGRDLRDPRLRLRHLGVSRHSLLREPLFEATTTQGNLPIYVSIYLSIYLSISASYLFIYFLST